MTDPRETAIAAGAEALRREGKHEQADLLDSVPSMVAALMGRAGSGGYKIEITRDLSKSDLPRLTHLTSKEA